MTPKTEASELDGAIQAVRTDPQNESLWDEVERLGAEGQTPDAVADAYRQALRADTTGELARLVGQRAAQWHEEWLGEDSSELREVLGRVLELDPTAAWAFQRLTVLHTSKGRWNELLAVYDQAIARAETKDQKRALLDEAANIAKDFASDADATVRYMRELVRLSPSDKQLAQALERQLERQGRWDDLVGLWRDRMPTLSKDDRTAYELRIADIAYGKQGDVEAALAVVQPLVDAGDRTPAAAELLEKIAADEAVEGSARRTALELLSTRYKAENRNADLVRTLEAALALGGGGGGAALHREAAERLRATGDERGALEHFVALLAIEPGDEDALDAVRAIARGVGDHKSLLRVLDGAAEAASGHAQYELTLEAAELARTDLGDVEGAVTRYHDALATTDASDADRAFVLRKLVRVFADAGRAEDELGALEKLMSVESELRDRKAVAGQAARAAERLGDMERAVAAWQFRLDADALDAEATDGLIGILEREGRHRELVDALVRRAKAHGSETAARTDWVRAANILARDLDDAEGSLEVWRSVIETFGEDAEAVDAMTELYARVEAWSDLATLLVRAAEREASHVAKVLNDAGHVQNERLEQPEEAVRSFARALALAPQHEGARGGLQALLEIDACRRAATDALADAFRRTDEWRGVLGLVDARLALAQNDVERVRILTDAASVVQTRGNDAEQAFDFIARAVPLAPENAGLTSDLLRLARATGRAGDAVPVLEAVLTELEAGSARVVELELELAELLERDLEDMPGAVARYAAALTTVPERRSVAEATLRTGGAAKDWARLAEAVLRHSATRGSLDAGLVEAVESNLATDDASGAFLDALDGAAADLSLDGKLAHDVALWRAELAESRVGDLARAKVALTQALSFEPLSRPALEAVVRLGRTNPDAGTLDALLRIASLDERNLDALADACETAADLGVPAEERERQLRRLYDRATVMWKDGMSALGERGPEQAARFALSSLVASLEARNAFGALASLASDAAQLPVDKTERHAWLARAAGAALRGGERDRAAGLYRTLLDEEPGHRSALDALAKLAEEDNRLPEMLSLRRTELALANDADRKLALRLDIVRLVGEIERQGGRVEALRTNLGERPGHIASIEALIQVLESTGRHAELADDLTAQAKHLENAGDAGTAARLWTRVATMAEYRLSDADRAVQAYRRVVELQATPQALDALARLRADSGDHASAAQWLERRLILATGDERAPIALRLAQEHFAADQRERAIKCLEIAFKESPSSPEIRDTLADAYRADKSWEQLAWVLTESSAYVQDHETLVRNAREATELYRTQGHLERAIPVLRRAVDAISDDRELRLSLADAYRVAGQHDDARPILEGLIEEFGRRRNAERAQIHFLLAQVEHAAGNNAAALEQLDQASGMDASNAEILRTLGDFALEGGDLPRAERAYRALLLVVRRQPPGDDPASVGTAEVQFALSLVAEGREDADQAKELLRSAIETSEPSDVETERLVRAMLKWNRPEAALEALEKRLPATDARAKTLAAIGKVLWSSLNRGDDGLVRFLESIDADPTDDSTHRQARVLAVEVDKSQAYADKLRDVASRLGAQDPRAGSEVLLRLVRVLEEDVQDYAAAQAVCAEIETIGFHRPEAWIALSRIAKARGDQSAEATALERLVSSNDVTVPPPVRTDAMFNLAALKLHTVGETDGGVELLSQALEREPRYTQVGSLLRSVGSADNSSLMSLYGRVARSSTDSAVLLDFLEKRATRADATIDDAKEAIELAKSLEAFDRLEPLLERGVSLARESEGGLEAYLWIPKQLTERRLAVGDVDGALRWTRTAAESTSGEQATALWLNAANLAVQAGERDAARTVYERLFEEAPTDRRVWEPYLGVLRESGEEERFNDVISTVVDGLEDAGARNAVRMERARYLLGLEGREPDAAEVLREVLQDEPGHTDAAKLLAAVFERTGYDEELVDLLAQQLEVARGGDDTDTIRELSLKLGSILARVRRDDAMDVYRRALSALPHDRDLASALLEILPEDHDARERAETMERILRSETGDDAAALTLDLASRWEALGDSEALERTLELGYGAAPEDEAVRERLEGFYRTREDWGSLAGFLVREARRVTNPKVSVAFLRNAASLYLDRLGDATTAAEVLHEACEVAPEDAELVSELVSARVSAGALAQAAEEVSAALERAAVTDEMRAFLLRARGGVRLAMEDDDAAISDLEQAYVLGGASMGSELADGLLQVAERANARGDQGARRNLVLRLVQVLSEVGRAERAREVLGTWVDEFAGDREAIELLCALDEAGERWDDLVESTRRLAAITEGADQSRAVMAHADACAKAGRPADAREALEATLRANPDDRALRERLQRLYEDAGAFAELAVLLMEDASLADNDDARHQLLRRAGHLFLQAGNAEAALAPLEEAVRLRPTDHESVLTLVDGFIAAERFPDAGQVLEQAIEAHPKRRSPELSQLQSRMAVLAEKAGDRNLQMQWLNAAVESDKSNGEIVAKLAYLAMDLREHDVALNALRIVTLSKSEGPMTRAMAFLLQARIAHEQGEQRKALLWARKAKSEDPDFAEADAFIAELGG